MRRYRPIRRAAPAGVVVRRGADSDVAASVVGLPGRRRPAVNGDPLPGPFAAVMIRTPYNRTADRYPREGEFWSGCGPLSMKHSRAMARS